MRRLLSTEGIRDAAVLNAALSDGTVRSIEGRAPHNTTPTRFEDFAVGLAGVYRAAAANPSSSSSLDHAPTEART